MMGFLKDDEFFLLMDIAATSGTDPSVYPVLPLNFYTHRTLDELKQLRDAGVQTTMNFQMIRQHVEPAPGVYDWSYLDEYVARATAADMKVLLFTTTHGLPKWYPDEFFCWGEDGVVHREALSPWNKEAQADQNAFIQKLIDRYYDPDHCMIINSQQSVGETVLLNEPAFYDPAAIKSYQEYAETEDPPIRTDPTVIGWLLNSYSRMLVEQQTLLAKQCNEVWLMLHPAIRDMGYFIGNGNSWIDELLFDLTTRVPGVRVNHIYYTWIQWPQYWPEMGACREKYHEHVFGGAEYAEGLPITTPPAIQQELRGQIIAPCYPGIHDHLEPWMLENIKIAQAAWERSKNL